VNTFAPLAARIEDKIMFGMQKAARQAEGGNIHDHVVSALKNIYDPEIPVNIYDLGLIYGIDINQENFVTIRMTLTAPGCPVAQTFPGTVEGLVRQVPGVNDVRVDLVWDPPWDQSRMSEATKLQLGLL
jgi:FeS assembly SUF system protein